MIEKGPSRETLGDSVFIINPLELTLANYWVSNTAPEYQNTFCQQIRLWQKDFCSLFISFFAEVWWQWRGGVGGGMNGGGGGGGGGSDVRNVVVMVAVMRLVIKIVFDKRFG
uniref:Uncharacterized protein n=1 Tax=Onchocerca volvulus TaxID=6282 RepID=A0A8R1XZS1_ONCVO